MPPYSAVRSNADLRVAHVVVLKLKLGAKAALWLTNFISVIQFTSVRRRYSVSAAELIFSSPHPQARCSGAFLIPRAWRTTRFLLGEKSNTQPEIFLYIRIRHLLFGLFTRFYQPSEIPVSHYHVQIYVQPWFFFIKRSRGYIRFTVGGAWLGVKTPYIGGNDRQMSKRLYAKNDRFPLSLLPRSQSINLGIKF